jgi:hypothetical protein
MKYSKAFFLLLALSLCFSCNRDDDDNTDQPTPIGRIFGQVMHHEDLIPDALVYIKYDATEFPGIDPSNYDDQVTVDSIDASFEFTNLGKVPIICSVLEMTKLASAKLSAVFP